MYPRDTVGTCSGLAVRRIPKCLPDGLTCCDRFIRRNRDSHRHVPAPVGGPRQWTSPDRRSVGFGIDLLRHGCLSQLRVAVYGGNSRGAAPVRHGALTDKQSWGRARPGYLQGSLLCPVWFASRVGRRHGRRASTPREASAGNIRVRAGAVLV